MSIFSVAKSVIYFGGAQVYIRDYNKGNITPNFVDHIFPYSNKPYVEFVGYKPTLYEIEGFFAIDGDWSLLKPVYEAIFASQTPQTLTLPDVGMVQAVCKEARLNESADHNGIVNCHLSFSYAPLSQSGFSLLAMIENPASVLTSLETNALSSITSDFTSSLTNMSLANITGPITSCLTSLGSTAQNLISSAGQVTGIDGLLSGMSLGRFSQAPMNPAILSGIDTSQANADIISDVQSNSSTFYSNTLNSLNAAISDASDSITSLI